MNSLINLHPGGSDPLFGPWDNIMVQTQVFLKLAMLSQEPIRTGSVGMWAPPGFLVSSHGFFFFSRKMWEVEPPLLRSLTAPHHFFRSTNFHLRHVELIFATAHIFFSLAFLKKLKHFVRKSYKNTTTKHPRLLSSASITDPVLLQIMCVAVFSFLSFPSSTFISYLK